MKDMQKFHVYDGKRGHSEIVKTMWTRTETWCPHFLPADRMKTQVHCDQCSSRDLRRKTVKLMLRPHDNAKGGSLQHSIKKSKLEGEYHQMSGLRYRPLIPTTGEARLENH